MDNQNFNYNSNQTSSANPADQNTNSAIDIYENPADSLNQAPPILPPANPAAAGDNFASIPNTNQSTQPQEATTENMAETPPAVTSTSDIEAIVEARHKEQDEIDQILTELETENINQLSQKYSAEKLSDSILIPKANLGKTVIDDFVLARHLFTIDFLEESIIPTIYDDSKEKILDTLASAGPGQKNEILETNLQAISPGVTLPANFKLDSYQPRAKELWQAQQNIKLIITEISVKEYFGDVLNFIKLPEEKFVELKGKVDDLVVRIATEYQTKSLKDDQEPSPLLFDQGFEILARVGRTPIYIQSLREEHNFGNLADIIGKIQFSLSIAEQINPIKKNLVDEAAVLEETKRILLTKIVLN